jgi:L-threonylcarbamoyladenylate synthase
MELLELHAENVEECVARMAQAVRDGELILFPTDTVYGIGGLAFSRRVLDRLQLIKPDRDVKPTAVLIDNIIRMSQIAGDIPSPKIVKLTEAFWPGPLTLIWKTSSVIPDEFQTKDRSLGYRVPHSEFLISIMKSTERALWATSANLPGQPAPRLFTEIDEKVMRECDLVIKTKKLLTGRASAVVDVRRKEPKMVRESALKLEDILRVWKAG